MPRSSLLVVSAVFAPLVAACAATLPTDRIERALYVDMLTMVRSQARAEWTVDRLALDNIGPGLAWSGCQVAPDKRESLLAWLDTRIALEETRLGGDAETAWRRHGKDLSVIDDLLELQRVRLALAGVHARAREDCPFWLEGDSPRGPRPPTSPSPPTVSARSWRPTPRSATAR